MLEERARKQLLLNIPGRENSKDIKLIMRTVNMEIIYQYTLNINNIMNLKPINSLLRSLQKFKKIVFIKMVKCRYFLRDELRKRLISALHRKEAAID